MSTENRTPARASVMSLAIKEKAALYASYMPYLKNGGLFVPTNKSYRLGDDIYLLVTLMDDPAKLPIAGQVVWITPENSYNGKTAGIGVQFPDGESGDTARLKIENLLGAAIKSSRVTHTI